MKVWGVSIPGPSERSRLLLLRCTDLPPLSCLILCSAFRDSLSPGLNAFSSNFGVMLWQWHFYLTYWNAFLCTQPSTNHQFCRLFKGRRTAILYSSQTCFYLFVLNSTLYNRLVHHTGNTRCWISVFHAWQIRKTTWKFVFKAPLKLKLKNMAAFWLQNYGKAPNLASHLLRIEKR